MFKKRRSEREPGRTLFKEIRETFGHYFSKAEEKLSRFLKRYPNQSYSAMLFLILFSLLLNFCFHNKPPEKKLEMPAAGIGGLVSTADALRHTIGLRSRVDALLSKPALNHADSAFLNQAIDSLLKIKP